LVLSGHTHGGQITFFGIAPFKPKGGKYLKVGILNLNQKCIFQKGIAPVFPIRWSRANGRKWIYIKTIGNKQARSIRNASA
jgi:hypothetical protein